MKQLIWNSSLWFKLRIFFVSQLNNYQVFVHSYLDSVGLRDEMVIFLFNLILDFCYNIFTICTQESNNHFSLLWRQQTGLSVTEMLQQCLIIPPKKWLWRRRTESFCFTDEKSSKQKMASKYNEFNARKDKCVKI